VTEPVEVTPDSVFSRWSRHNSLTTAVFDVRLRLPQSTLKYQPETQQQLQFLPSATINTAHVIMW